jgi:hypothetical protein
MPKLLWNGSMRYYAYSDEKAFFTWLESIKGVRRVQGIGNQLVIHLRSKRLSDQTLRDLIAIYTRYEGDMSQLATFLTPKNKDWFKNKNAYWHASVFKSSKKRRR